MLSEEDKALAQELGLGNLPEEQQAEQVMVFKSTLDKNIGMALEEALTDEQLEAFGKVADQGDEAAAEAWLHQAIPNYDQIVEQQAAELKQFIKDRAAQIRQAVDEAASEPASNDQA
jgi:hypothetical protein